MHIFFLTLLFLFNCTISNIQRETYKLSEPNHPKKTLPYWLYNPKSHLEGSKYPLLIFLHGIGERGSNPEKLFIHGPPKLVKNGKDFPFFILAPQLSIHKDSWNEDELYELIVQIIKNYPIDDRKIYLTGLSLGGNGVWKLAMKYPDLFAALVPISGWGDVNRVCKLRNIPTWVFHGQKDKVIPISNSIDLVDRLSLCNRNVEFSLYKDKGHDAWTDTYNNTELYLWLLKQTKETKKKEQYNKTFSENKPLNILIIGDSLGQSFFQGLIDIVSKKYNLKIENKAKVSSGLIVQSFYHWPENLKKITSSNKYDLIIVFIGANDYQSFSWNQKRYVYGMDNWRQEYSTRIEELVDISVRHNYCRVYWITLPPMRPERYHSQTRIINQVIYDTLDRIEYFKIIETKYILGDSNGNYSEYIDFKGKKIWARQEDGIHLTYLSAKKLMDEVLKHIYTDFYFSE